MRPTGLIVSLVAPMALAMLMTLAGCGSDRHDYDRDSDRQDQHRDSGQHDDDRGGR